MDDNIKLNIKDSQIFYDYYKNNKYFLDAFANVMLNARDEINKNFEGISTTIDGRIKSEDSFNAKVKQKLENESPDIFDVYAFKIIVDKVDRDYKSTNPSIMNLQKRLSALDSEYEDLLSLPNLDTKQEKLLKAIDNLKAKLEKQLGDLVSIEISNYLTSDNSTFLSNTGASNMPERNKDYNKPNGFLSHQHTLKMNPDPKNPEANCYVEIQIRPVQAELIAVDNHWGFKFEKYGFDVYDFPEDDFDNCSSLEEFEQLYEKSIPTYVYLHGDKAIKCPCFINFMYFYSDYLFEKKVDENGNVVKDENGEAIYVHQNKLDKLEKFSRGFKRDSSFDMNLHDGDRDEI